MTDWQGEAERGARRFAEIDAVAAMADSRGRTDRGAQTLAWLRANGPATVAELAAGLGVSRSAAYGALGYARIRYPEVRCNSVGPPHSFYVVAGVPARQSIAGGASKALADATAQLGVIAAHMTAMGEALAAESDSYAAVGRSLDRVESRIGALAELAARWEAEAAVIGPGEYMRVANALRRCARELREAIGG